MFLGVCKYQVQSEGLGLKNKQVSYVVEIQHPNVLSCVGWYKLHCWIQCCSTLQVQNEYQTDDAGTPLV